MEPYQKLPELPRLLTILKKISFLALPLTLMKASWTTNTCKEANHQLIFVGDDVLSSTVKIQITDEYYCIQKTGSNKWF
ncbi:unnamed protein product [Rhizophagus irregularis]|nr:unnamed protein product [Rhizophagus irregularis]